MDQKEKNRSHTADLWRCYRAAFDKYAQSARAVQELKAASNPSQAALDTALLELDRARLLYNGCRDVLAFALRFPGEPQPQRTSAPRVADQFERVKSIAELLWEADGRPQGNADENWYRAERIIHAATLASAATPAPASARP